MDLSAFISSASGAPRLHPSGAGGRNGSATQTDSPGGATPDWFAVTNQEMDKDWGQGGLPRRLAEGGPVEAQGAKDNGPWSAIPYHEGPSENEGDAGALEKYKNLPTSENIEDRRGETMEGGSAAAGVWKTRPEVIPDIKPSGKPVRGKKADLSGAAEASDSLNPKGYAEGGEVTDDDEEQDAGEDEALSAQEDKLLQDEDAGNTGENASTAGGGWDHTRDDEDTPHEGGIPDDETEGQGTEGSATEGYSRPKLPRPEPGHEDRTGWLSHAAQLAKDALDYAKQKFGVDGATPDPNSQQNIKALLQGAGAASHIHVAAAEHAADPDGELSPWQRHMKTLSDLASFYGPDQGKEAVHSVMQYDRNIFAGYGSHAIVAAEQGHPLNAARNATEALSNVPGKYEIEVKAISAPQTVPASGQQPSQQEEAQPPQQQQPPQQNQRQVPQGPPPPPFRGDLEPRVMHHPGGADTYEIAVHDPASGKLLSSTPVTSQQLIQFLKTGFDDHIKLGSENVAAAVAPRTAPLGTLPDEVPNMTPGQAAPGQAQGFVPQQAGGGSQQGRAPSGQGGQRQGRTSPRDAALFSERAKEGYPDPRNNEGGNGFQWPNAASDRAGTTRPAQDVEGEWIPKTGPKAAAYQKQKNFEATQQGRNDRRTSVDALGQKQIDSREKLAHETAEHQQKGRDDTARRAYALEGAKEAVKNLSGDDPNRSKIYQDTYRQLHENWGKTPAIPDGGKQHFQSYEEYAAARKKDPSIRANGGTP